MVRPLDPGPGRHGGPGHGTPLQQFVVTEPSPRLHSPVLLQPCFEKPHGVAPSVHFCPFTGSGPILGLTFLKPEILHSTTVPFGATAAEPQVAQTGRATSFRCHGPRGDGEEKRTICEFVCHAATPQLPTNSET
jgi:hypothetical protein